MNVADTLEAPCGNPLDYTREAPAIMAGASSHTGGQYPDEKIIYTNLCACLLFVAIP